MASVGLEPPTESFPQQAHSGGVRLAQEFDAKATLAADGPSPRCVQPAQELAAGGKPGRPNTVELRVSTGSWPLGAWPPAAASPHFIAASHPPSLAASPDKASHRSSLGSRQDSEEPPLKRQYSTDSGASQQGGRGCSKSRRSSLSASPTKGRDWVITTADGGQCVEPDGLHFLLKTCELLDPEMMGCSRPAEGGREAAGHSPKKGVPPRAPRSRRTHPPSQPASPAKATRGRQAAAAEQAVAQHTQQAQRAGRDSSYFRPEADSDNEYMGEDGEEEADAAPAEHSSDGDDEYVPRRAPAGRGARGGRGAATRATAAAAQLAQHAGPTTRAHGAAEVAPAREGPAAEQSVAAQQQQQQPAFSGNAAAPTASGSSQDTGGAAATAATAPPAAPAAPINTAILATGGRSSMVSGPCMNPDCEHPYDSPQWRKGPANAPVLCNACGTRWLRNGTLKPLVPRRGIRYKNKPRTVSAPPTGKAAIRAAAAAARQAERAAAEAAAAAAQQAAEAPGVAAPAQQQQQPAVLLNPALLAALFGGQVASSVSSAGAFNLPLGALSAEQLVSANSAAASSWLSQQQAAAAAHQQQADGQAQAVQPAPAPAAPAAHSQQQAILNKGSGSQQQPAVFQLQAMAGMPVFLAAPPALFQQPQQ